MIEMKGRVRENKNPVMQPCGKIHIDGVRYAHFVNTDHLLIWYKSVGNYIYGKKDSGRCSVKTGGREKDNFM